MRPLRRIWTSFSYQHRIAFLILLFALTPILLSGVFFLLREYRVRERAILEGFSASLQTGVHFVNGILQTSHIKILYVSSNQDLHLILSTPIEGNLRPIVASYQGVRDLFKTYMELDAYRSSIAVYALLPGVYHAEYSLPIEDLDPSIREAILGKAPGDIYCSLLGGRFCIATQVVSASSELLGIAEITVPFRVVSDVFRFAIPEGAFLAYATSDLSSVMPIPAAEGEDDHIAATVRQVDSI